MADATVEITDKGGAGGADLAALLGLANGEVAELRARALHRLEKLTEEALTDDTWSTMDDDN